MGTPKWMPLLGLALALVAGCYYYEEDYLRNRDPYARETYADPYGTYDPRVQPPPPPAWGDPQADPAPAPLPEEPVYEPPAPREPVESDFDLRIRIVGARPEAQEDIERAVRAVEGVDQAATLRYEGGELWVGVRYDGSIRALKEAVAGIVRGRASRFAIELLGGAAPAPQPLEVRIFAPAEGARLDAATVFVGVEVLGADRPEVTVNGVPAEPLDTPGHFMARILCDEGENRIVATAQDSAGGIGKDMVRVTVSPGEPVIEDQALSVLVQGRVNDPLSTVTVDGRPVAVEPDGSYRVEVSLKKGQEFVVVVAVDSVGNKTVRKIPVGGR